jgi:arylformamidase
VRPTVGRPRDSGCLAAHARRSVPGREGGIAETYAPNREQLIKRRIRDSELARHRSGEPERLAYGSAEIERLDIYRTRRKLAPVFIFIHGGAWRSGRSKDFAGPAEMFLAGGAHYVVPDFAWVQDVGGNLMVLTDQVYRAVA